MVARWVVLAVGLAVTGCSHADNATPAPAPDPCGLVCRDGVCEIEPAGVRVANLTLSRGDLVYTRTADGADACTLERVSTESCTRQSLARFPQCPVVAAAGDRIVWGTPRMQTCALPDCADTHAVTLEGGAFATDGTDIYYAKSAGRVAKCAGDRGCVRTGETIVGEFGVRPITQLLVDGADLFTIDDNGKIQQCPKDDCSAPTVIASRALGVPTFLAAGTSHLLFVAADEPFVCAKSGCGGAPTPFAGEPGWQRGTTRIDGDDLYFFNGRSLVSCPVTGCQGPAREVVKGAGRGGKELPLVLNATHVFYSNIDGGLFRAPKHAR